MKALKLVIITLAIGISVNVPAQDSPRSIAPFNRIIASPRIHIILEEGDSESVRLVSSNIDESKIHVEVRGKTLRLFLEDARVTDKLERDENGLKRSIYDGANVTAYITYKNLEHLEIRGAQELTCLSPIRADKKFKLKAYGENEINLISVRTDYLKTVMYGQNRLKIKGGKANYQKYKLYGENRIDATGMKSYSTSATSFGESTVRVHSQNEVRITAFGDTRVSYTGDAFLSKGLIVGKTDISRHGRDEDE